MGEDPHTKVRDDFRGIERDIWIEELVEQLRMDFFRAIAAGEQQRAQEHVEQFEASLGRLPPPLRDQVISETTVMLTEELKAKRESHPQSD